MTDAELQGLALQALNIAKKDYEANELICLLANYHQNEGIHRMQSLEAKIAKTLGKDWLNNPVLKHRGFRAMRAVMQILPCDAFVIVTAANVFYPTPALGLLSREERLAILNAGHDRHHQAIKEGLLEMHDTLVAVAQTPERTCSYIQRIDSYRGYDGPPTVLFADQREFHGTLKIFP